MGCAPLPPEIRVDFQTAFMPPTEELTPEKLRKTAQELAQDFAAVTGIDPRFLNPEKEVADLLETQGPLAAYTYLTEGSMYLCHLYGLGNPDAHL